MLFGISAAGRDEDLSCKVTVFLERVPDNFTGCHGFLLGLSASLPLFPCTIFLLHTSSLLSLHTRKVFCLPVLSHSSPQFHICFSSANSTWLCPLVFATADDSGADKSTSMTGGGTDARGLAWSHRTGTDARSVLSPPTPPTKSQYHQLSPAKRRRWRGRWKRFD